MISFGVISKGDHALQELNAFKSSGKQVVFIFHDADPLHELQTGKFLYVSTQSEINEKVRLLEADVTALDEAMRL